MPTRTEVPPADVSAAPHPTPIRVTGLYLIGLLALAALAAFHITQGTSSVTAGDLIGLLTGSGDENTWNVLVASRLPRLLAGITVGVALGTAGALLQSVARNPLAAPDTLGVNAGAFLAVVAAAAFGLSLPVLSGGLVAFAGGLAAAAIVMTLSAGGWSGPTRLILAGSALTLAFWSLSFLLLIMFQEGTIGLFAWAHGSLDQTGVGPALQLLPIVGIGLIASLALAARLDIMALGDDTARTLGVPVQRTRLMATVVSVLLTAVAVTLVGPIGFVGLCAPAAVRLLGPLVPGVHRHRALVPLSGLAGALVVIGADVFLRALGTGAWGVEIPTGVPTTMLGAAVLIAIASRHRSGAVSRSAPAANSARLRSVASFRLVLGLAAVVTVAAVFGGLLLGDTVLRTGDITNWLSGQAGLKVSYVLDERTPRVAAALLAGMALAVAGTAVQAVCRNPLAEPGILGITAGAGVGAIAVLTAAPLAGIWAMSSAAGAGALVAFGLVYALSWRGGLDSDRLVLVGIAVWSGGMAIITFLIIRSDPYNTAKALTWLSGSTYGRTFTQVAPVFVALLLALPVLAHLAHQLDLLALDDDTPRVLGVRLERTRLFVLTGSALLTATAVSAVGVVGFVGLVAPHAARALVGSRHTRVLPVAALLGASLVSIADTLGRTVIAPAQIPAGLVTALIGTPYFLWLLARTRN